MSKSRIFLLLLLSFIGGVAFRSFIDLPLFFVWAAIVVGVVLIAAGFLRGHRAAIIYGFLFLAFLAGVFRYTMVDESRPELTGLLGQNIRIRGFVAAEPDMAQSVQRLKVKVETAESKDLRAPIFTLLTLRRFPEYRLGDELSIQGVLEAPTAYSDFDYPAYLAKDEIFSIMRFPVLQKTGEGRGSKLQLTLSKLKHAFEEKIDLALPEPHGAFLKGLTLGEREALPKDLVENFNRTGTTHIVALSGYNITMVGRFFIAFLLLISVPFQLAFWIASAGILLFVMLTGAAPSVVRAGIMGILVLVARREGRIYSMTNALAFAGAAMIFHNPKILRFDAAFQLSFLATLGLVYLSPHVEKFFEKTGHRLSLFLFRRRVLLTHSEKLRKERDKKYSLFPFKQIFIETLSAQLMVLPLIIYIFGRASIVSPVTNLLILIAVPYSMVLGFVTGFLGFLWQPLAAASGWITWAFLEYKLRVIEFAALLPLASVEIGKWAIIPVLLIYGWAFWKLKKAPKI